MELENTINTLARTVFGIHMLRPFQQIVIQRVLELDGRNIDHKGLLVTLPTGSGKSLCFMLPSLLVEGLTVIVYPLLSLMNDQVRRFTQRGIGCIAIQGGQTQEHRRALFDSIGVHACRVVITNAECLGQASVIGELSRHTISLLVIDEAHTIVRWGEGFRPALAALGPLVAYLPVKQILCFTATADQAVIEGLNRSIFLKNRPHLVRASSDRPNISYHAYRTLSKDHAVSTLLADKASRPALVFCNTREGTYFACKAFLRSHPDIPCRYYHAGLDGVQRKGLETWFDHQEEGVLFSTNAFGMGVDKSTIRTVIHREVPDDALAYLQESGRAGRDGRQSRAVVLLDSNETGTMVSLFSSTTVCYRQNLLAQLGEEVDFCNGCDVCNHAVQEKREGEEALLSCIASHPFRYSPGSLATMLSSKKGCNSHASVLSTWSEKEIRSALHLLLAEGRIGTFKVRRRLYLKMKTYGELLTTLRLYKMLKYGTKATGKDTSEIVSYASPPVSSRQTVASTKQGCGKKDGSLVEEVAAVAHIH
ncbi:MAG: ATP-dependent DNA helicase RecQ [Spirochaetales bacterium]|nr:ATP-dependent DNA helicase RecQ [Spirochaetales bacterium]